MASLPPGWAADYDGQRWFFTYDPTGQSQFHFPRPGDEFPDLVPYCCGVGFGAGGGACAGDDVLHAGEEGLLSPGERRLGGEKRQVRRVSDTGSAGDVVHEERALREAGGRDGVGAVCFGNFAAVSNSRGGRGLGCVVVGKDGTRTMGSGQSGRCGVGDGFGILSTTGVADGASGKRSGEPVAAPLEADCEHTQADSSSHREADSTATILIMSEPVLVTMAETTTAAPPLYQQDTHMLAAVAGLSPPHELPTPAGRAMDSVHASPPWVLAVGDIPELYSESTALCEEEINPPPVELPCDDDEVGWRHGQPILPNAAFEDIFELPAYEETGISLLGNRNSDALSEPDCLPGVYAVTSRSGQAYVPGAKVRGQGRDSLPSQASRTSPEKQLDQTSLRERVNSGLGRMPLARGDDKPATEGTGTEQRDLTHFPTILRPGPRWSGQQQPPPPVVPTPVTNTSHAAHARFIRQQKPREQQQQQEHKEQAEARTSPPSHEQPPARMPTMPLQLHPDEPHQTARRATAIPEAPPPPFHPCGARQDRLPGSVNLVIPIRHTTEQPQLRRVGQ